MTRWLCRCAGAALAAAVLLTISTPAPGQLAPDQDLPKAVRALRRIDPRRIPPEQRQAKGVEVQAAWETIMAAGETGRTALKAELREIEQTKERDDFFKLSAAALLWQLGNLDEAPTIAAIWDTTPLDVQFNYSFSTALAAARTQDKRVLPMLLAFSRDKKGTFFVPMHSMTLEWPTTVRIVWGLYGPDGLDALNRMLQTSTDSGQIESAAGLLAQAQYLGALERIRKLATDSKGDLKKAAVFGLGAFGHPKDFDLLLAGLKSKDMEEVWPCVQALADYGDLRAVPGLLPLLKADDKLVRQDVLIALTELVTPEGVDALKDYMDHQTDRDEKEYFHSFLDYGFLASVKLDWETYAKKTADEKKEVTAQFLSKAQDEFTLSPDDRKLTREEFVQALADWKKRGSINGGDFAWVESRHILAVATPQDILAILEVKASVYRRLSDECLAETEKLDEIVQRLGRARYRKEVGTCLMVQEKGQ